MADAGKTHTAAASATGYLFQCRYALLMGIEAIPNSPELQISVEKFDDIAFETDSQPVELIQTKHHIAKHGSLSDASPDLWNTLLIWSKRVAADIESPFRTKFILLTTAVAPKDSAASLLRTMDRDENEADKRLMATASTSTNSDLSSAYRAYKNLPEQLRKSMLRACLILDKSPNIIDVREEIAQKLYHAVTHDKLDHFVERLEGWWFTLIIKALADHTANVIPVLTIDQRIDELREEFKRSGLPVDFSAELPSAAVVAELDKRSFVTQLRRINIGDRRIEYAIRDYYRASEQRSRWAREDLLLDGELVNYERQLVEAWEPRFAAMLDDLVEGSTSAERISAGRLLFKWAELDALFPLRSVTDRFLTHGSYHILANHYIVGWHPDFKQDELIETSEAQD